MKSFYSLIKISPNEMSGESLTIGLILSTEGKLRLKFSKTKKNLAKSILPAAGSIIDFLENEIQHKVDEQQKILTQNKNFLFELPTLFSADYFSYLSKYSNGLLKFSEPAIIADIIDDEKFEQLFRLFVYDDQNNSEKTLLKNKSIEKAFYQKVETNLIARVKDKVHTNQSLDNQIVPTLFKPFQIDCLGLNGVLIGAKSLPFTQSKETLHKNINTYISVIAHLSSAHNKSLAENKFYLIADQPKKHSPAYELWKQLFNNEKLIKLISADESGQVADLIEEKKAVKFIL